MNRIPAVLALSALVWPVTASAHIKWFVEFDTTKAPEPIMQVLTTPGFWWLLLLSVAAIYVSSVFDRRIPSLTDLAEWQPKLERWHSFVPQIMRYGTGTFFLILSASFPYILLTPELVTDNPWLRYVHVFIAVLAFHRRTSFMAGLGIIFLYSYSIQLYGTFHMLDYIIFVGTGVYLIVQTVRPAGIQGLDLELLRFVLCYSFLWGGLEKFTQPDLFYKLLEGHAYLAMGLDWEFFVRACGFVEICLAWHIYTGKLAAYLAIAVLALLVVIAFIPFGVTDMIGHFLFIVPLIAVLLTPRKEVVFKTAVANTFGFLVALLGFLLLSYVSYFILHYHLHPHLNL